MRTYQFLSRNTAIVSITLLITLLITLTLVVVYLFLKPANTCKDNCDYMVVAEETTQYLTQDEVRYAKSQLVPSTDYTYSQVISSTTNEKYDNSSTTKTMTDQEISDLYADQQNKISSVSEIKVESSDETLQIKNVTVHKTDAEKTTRSAKGFVFAIDTDKQIIVFVDKEDHYKAFVSNDTIFTVDGKRFLFSSLEQGDIITVSGQSAVNSNEIQASTVILTGVFETPIVNDSEI